MRENIWITEIEFRHDFAEFSYVKPDLLHPSIYVFMLNKPIKGESHCANKVLQTNFSNLAIIHIFRAAKNPTFIWTMSNKSTWVLPIT